MPREFLFSPLLPVNNVLNLAVANSVLSGQSSLGSALRVAFSNLSHLINSKLSACAATNILGMGHWFKVLRIHARPIAASVVKFQSCGDRSDMSFVDNYMGFTKTSPVEHATIATSNTALPNPAASLLVFDILWLLGSCLMIVDVPLQSLVAIVRSRLPAAAITNANKLWVFDVKLTGHGEPPIRGAAPEAIVSGTPASLCQLYHWEV
jgi:hypothetical protein